MQCSRLYSNSMIYKYKYILHAQDSIGRKCKAWLMLILRYAWVQSESYADNHIGIQYSSCMDFANLTIYLYIYILIQKYPSLLETRDAVRTFHERWKLWTIKYVRSRLHLQVVFYNLQLFLLHRNGNCKLLLLHTLFYTNKDADAIGITQFE